MAKMDLIGQTYNQLTVIELAPSAKRWRTQWRCLCSCGNKTIVKAEALRSGDTKSCGCLNNQKRKERAKKMYQARQKWTPQQASAKVVFDSNYSDGNLTFEDFMRYTQYDCFYCGGKPDNITNVHISLKFSSDHAKQNGDFIYNGLDRVDNSLPHNINNVVPCCKICNYSKREMSFEDFINYLDKLKIFQLSKNVN